MVVVNVIQYKFRTELLDDFEYRDSQLCRGHAATTASSKDQEGQSRNASSQNFWKKTFSASSLRRTLSVASLRAKGQREANRLKVDSKSPENGKSVKAGVADGSESEAEDDGSEVKVPIYGLGQGHGSRYEDSEDESSGDEGPRYSERGMAR